MTTKHEKLTLRSFGNQTIMIVLFKILALFRFKAIRSSWLTLNEIMIALIAKGTQGKSGTAPSHGNPLDFSNYPYPSSHIPYPYFLTYPLDSTAIHRERHSETHSLLCPPPRIHSLIRNTDPLGFASSDPGVRILNGTSHGIWSLCVCRKKSTILASYRKKTGRHNFLIILIFCNLYNFLNVFTA